MSAYAITRPHSDNVSLQSRRATALSPSGASTRSEVIGRSSDEGATSVIDNASHHIRYRHEMVSWIRKGPLPPRRPGRADRSDYRPRGACLHVVQA